MEVVALLRDLAIIILALVWILVGLAVGALLFLFWRAFRAARARAATLGEAANELIATAKSAANEAATGVRTISATASFVGDQVVEPVITISAAVAAATRFVEALLWPRRHGASNDGKR